MDCEEAGSNLPFAVPGVVMTPSTIQKHGNVLRKPIEHLNLTPLPQL